MPEHISEWLKTTIPGIILLGVAATFVAYLIATALRQLVTPFLLWVFRWMFVKGPDFITAGIIRDHARYRSAGGADRAMAFYAFQIMKLAVAIAVFFVTWIYLALGMISGLSTIARVLLIGFQFTFFWIGLRAFLSVMFVMSFNESHIQKMIDEHQKSDVNARSNPA